MVEDNILTMEGERKARKYLLKKLKKKIEGIAMKLRADCEVLWLI